MQVHGSKALASATLALPRLKSSGGQVCAGAKFVLGPSLCWGQVCAGAKFVLGPSLCWGQVCN
jgi:hypothetical protein